MELHASLRQHNLKQSPCERSAGALSVPLPSAVFVLVPSGGGRGISVAARVIWRSQKTCRTGLAACGSLAA